MAAGLPNTKHIVIDGFINSGGQKMSKSIGNVINPYDIVAEYGTDALRYYCLRDLSPFEDSDVTMGHSGHQGVAASQRTADPDSALWDALAQAPDEGASITQLVAATQMSRRWVYYRLRTHARTGRPTEFLLTHWVGEMVVLGVGRLNRIFTVKSSIFSTMMSR